MSVVILGGNECMERQYKEICKEYNCKAKVFARPIGSLKNKLGSPDLMIFFTSTMSHKMVKSAMTELIRRMSDDGEFPHEIGLFLSYPPEDVRGFIKNRRSGCKLVGTWKVYGDEENAKHKFDLYKKCTDTYRRQWADGKTLSELAVPCC